MQTGLVGKTDGTECMKYECPYCSEKNWVCFSTGDGTSPDDEACRCYDCQKLFWLHENMVEVRKDIGESTDIEDAFIVDGQSSLK